MFFYNHSDLQKRPQMLHLETPSLTPSVLQLILCTSHLHLFNLTAAFTPHWGLVSPAALLSACRRWPEIIICSQPPVSFLTAVWKADCLLPGLEGIQIQQMTIEAILTKKVTDPLKNEHTVVTSSEIFMWRWNINIDYRILLPPCCYAF